MEFVGLKQKVDAGVKPQKFLEELKHFPKEYEKYLIGCKFDEDDAFKYYYTDNYGGTYYLFYSYLFRSSESHHGCCRRCRKSKVYRFNLLNLCEKMCSKIHLAMARRTIFPKHIMDVNML